MRLFTCGLVVMALCSLVLITSTNAYTQYRPSACVDCWGRHVPVGYQYYDGCNFCKCERHSPAGAMCTGRMCRYNRCSKYARQ